MSKRDIIFYLHIHQPFRVQPYTVFDIGENQNYFLGHEERTDNEAIFHKVAKKSYYPMIALLKKLIATYPNFALNLSVSGLFLEQCEQWDTELLKELQGLIATGRVEVLAETYHHTLSFFYSRFEFEKQVYMHREAIEKYFGKTPRYFRNTELAYNNDLANWVEEAGYKGVLAEGWDPVLGWKSPHYLYRPRTANDIILFMKDYHLSDDLAFRYSDRTWNEWPLTPAKYRSWIEKLPEEEKLINLFMDFETFGEHQWSDTGIFDFFEDFAGGWCEDGNSFLTLDEAANAYEPVGTIDMPYIVTWADNERDLSAWTGNPMQRTAIEGVYALENEILRCGDDQLIRDWRALQTSDHYYYMCTKWFTDGSVHAYFSPYSSPYDGYLYVMNALRDIRYRLYALKRRGID